MSTAAPPSVPSSVDRENPWPGLTTFSEEQTAFFFGRGTEVRELYRRVDRQSLTVLFGQSGLGKSSLLQAGLFPRLRAEHYCPVYVRLDHGPDAPSLTEQIKGVVFRETRAAGTWTKAGSSVMDETLWEFFHHRDDQLRAPDGSLVTPVLIFDQFEELFTLGSAAEATRKRAEAFVAELADLVENRPPARLEARMESESSEIDAFDFSRTDYRILVALREDYLPHLESLKGSMPSLMQNRMRLTRMRASQALEAIVKPGEGLVSEEVATAIATFVAGRPDLENAEIEPSLLSLVCRELNTQRQKRGEKEIGASLLAGTRDTILQEFYERSLADQPAAVRHFIEDELLTESGHRENVALDRAQKRISQAGADPHSLDVLVNRRLLRIEERLDVRRVELTHDVLCGVVKASREVRREREAKENAERLLAETRAKEAAVQRSLTRARMVALICGVLALGAAGSALFGYFNLRRARAAEQEAKAAEADARGSADRALAIQEMSQEARGSAETLVTYILDDFYHELEPIGRLDVVAELAKRSAEYYRTLPLSLRNPTTVRNQALADARYATVLARQAKMDEAKPVLNESLHLFERLSANGDDSDELAIGWATALIAQANMTYTTFNASGAVVPATKAVELLRPKAKAGASNLVWNTLADSLDRQGFMYLRSAQYNKAIDSLQQARAIYDHLRTANPPVRTAQSSLAQSGSWLCEALAFTGKLPEAVAVAHESLDAANQALVLNPVDRGALKARGLAYDDLAQALGDSLDDKAALEMNAKGLATWQEMLRLDPTNATARHNSAASYGFRSITLGNQGRINEAEDALVAGVDALEKGRMTGDDYGAGVLYYRIIANNESQLGHVAGAEAALEKSGQYRKKFLESQPPESVGRFNSETYLDYSKADILAARGDFEGAAKLAGAALERARSFGDQTDERRKTKRDAVRNLDDNLATYELHLGHYERVAALEKEAVENEKAEGPSVIADYRTLHVSETYEAQGLILSGHASEGLELIAPVITFERGLAKMATSPEAAQELELAYALYVEAIGQPAGSEAKRDADLQEAQHLVEALPSEAQQWRQVQDLKGFLAAPTKA